MRTDSELLRAYVEDASDGAFTEIVNRYIGLVYFAALRQLGGDAHGARDIAQAVFCDLSRKAASLTNRDSLAGWLHTSTRFAASKLRRAEYTRQKYELESSMNTDLEGNPASQEWERLRPVIDEVLQEIPERDREALLLRLLQDRGFAEVGAALRISEDAARMRVTRALEALRRALKGRGIESTSAALAVTVTQAAGAFPPAGLAASIAQTALTTAALTGTGIVGATLMAKSTPVLASVFALFALCTTAWQWSNAQHARRAASAMALERDSALRESEVGRELARTTANRIGVLKTELETMKSSAVSRVTSEIVQPPRSDATIGMQRWEIQEAALANLRQIDAARKQYHTEKGSPAAALNDLVGTGGFIKTMRTVAGEDYSSLPMNPGEPLTVRTPSGIIVTFDPSGSTTTQPDFPPEIRRLDEMSQRLRPLIQEALKSYQSAHNGGMPADEKALLPYFPTPKDGADFVEAMEAKKAAGL
jgi:RNA polymerase sigma factor (sigma-70 family)